MCTFTIPFEEDAEMLIKRAKIEITRAGGSLMGNALEGDFQASTPIGSIKGSYQIEGKNISIAVTKKPFLLSCKRIQKELTVIMI